MALDVFLPFVLWITIVLVILDFPCKLQNEYACHLTSKRRQRNSRVALLLPLLSVSKVLAGLDAYFQRTGFEAIANGKCYLSSDISVVKVANLRASAINAD